MWGILLSGYEVFKSDTEASWTGLNPVVYKLPAFYHILQKVGVYAIAIAIVLSGIGLTWAAHNPQKLGEAKDKVVRVFAAALGIFSVAGIVTLIYSIAI